MGYEILTQPQIFTKRLTALGGIEGYIPPYIAQYYTWTIQTTAPSLSFDIPFTWTGLSHAPSEGYIVNIDGVLQPPPSYFVDVDRYILFFTNPIPAGKTIFLTQVGTIALTSTNYEELFVRRLSAVNLSATNGVIDNLRVTNKITDPLNVNVLSAEIINVDVNTSQPAVRITQRGTGPALLVQDEAGDASPFVINDQGQVVIGSPTAFNTNGSLQITSDSTTAANGNLIVQQINSTGNGATVQVRRAFGTLQSLQALSDSVQTGAITFNGYDGTGFRQAGAVYAVTEGTPAPGTMSANLRFNTLSNGTPGERMRISSIGNLGIGTTNPTQKLHVQGDRVLQTIDSTISTNSPILQQDLTPLYIDTKSGIEVTDPTNQFLTTGGDSHALHFERIVPIKPVNYWSTASTITTSSFILPGLYPLQTEPEAYIVTVGGVVQPKTVYSIDSIARRINFVVNIPPGADVYVLQTLNPLLSAGYDAAYPTQIISTISPGSPSVTLSGLTRPWSDASDDYFVSVDGVNQIPQFPNGTNRYTVFPTTSTLTFAGTIPGTFLTTITRLPSAASQVGPLNEACFLAQSYNWSFATTGDQSIFTLTGGPSNLLSDKACYLVNVGGVLQVPDRYNVNAVTRTVTLAIPVPGGVDVSVTQLAQPEFPVRYSTIFSIADECNNTSNGQAEEVVRIKPGFVSVQGSFATSPPITISGSLSTTTLPFSASSVIFSTSVACSATLPRPNQNIGRWIFIKNIAAFPIFSTSFNILPITSSTPTNSLLTGTAGRWAQLQSNGTQWVIMAQGGA